MDNFLSIFISKIPDNLEISDVFPEKRNQEIKNCKSDVVKKERFWAWKILESAVKETTGLKLEDIDISKLDNGKWVSKKLYFSLTHSHGLVAVAVSSKSVGIDIETWTEFENKKYSLENMVKRFLSENELAIYSDAANKRRFLELWTKKEAAFKENPSDDGFYSKNIELDNNKLFTKYDFFDDKEYCLSVCSELKNIMKIYEKK